MKYKNQNITPQVVKEANGLYSASIKELSGIKVSGSSALEVEQKLKELLQMIQMSDSGNEIDWANQLSEKERIAIMQGIRDFENGNIHSHEEALKIYGRYL